MPKLLRETGTGPLVGSSERTDPTIKSGTGADFGSQTSALPVSHAVHGKPGTALTSYVVNAASSRTVCFSLAVNLMPCRGICFQYSFRLKHFVNIPGLCFALLVNVL